MNKKFKFSIIMAVYNVEEYIKEAIDSIINQSLSFEENVQLILVDDGSTDGSYSICESYHEKFPNNILLLSKENGGAGSARNFGLNYVYGDYVNFFDSDDILSENTLQEVLNFFELHKNDIDFVAIPISWFGATDKEHPLNYKFDGYDKVVDLLEKPEFIQLHPTSSFFKKEVVINYRFLENTVRSEDAFLINQILINNPRYGIINSPMYYYRKRFSESSLTDIAKLKKEFYLDYLDDYCFKLIDYSKEKFNYVPKFIQYLLIYEFKPILYSKHIFDILNELEYNKFLEKIRRLLSFIDNEIILNHLSINSYLKSFLMYLKNDDFHIVARPQKNKVFLKSKDFIINKLHNHFLHIYNVDLVDENLKIQGLFASSCRTDYLTINAINLNLSSDNNFIGSKIENLDDNEDLKLLGISWKFYYNFEFDIPINQLDDNEFKLFIKYSEDEEVIFYPKIKLKDSCKLLTSQYIICDDKIIYVNDNLFYVSNNSIKSRIKFKLKKYN